jgi:heme A synthase
MLTRPFSSSERLYIRLASLTACLLLVLIAFGAVVRVTEAETHCEGGWPLCHDSLFPPLHDELAWIDWGHRLSTLLVGLLTIGTFWVGYRFLRNDPNVMLPLYAVLGLYVVQSLLGAITVFAHQSSGFALLHLGLAIIMLSCPIASLTALLYTPVSTPIPESLSTAIQAVTLLTFMVMMTGAVVVVGGASEACSGWPVCNGDTELQVINLVHRGCVLLLGLLLGTLFWRVQTEQPQANLIRTMILVLLSLYLIQFSLGALYVLLDFGRALSALHVIFAGLTWAAAVSLNTMTIKQQQVQEI